VLAGSAGVVRNAVVVGAADAVVAAEQLGQLGRTVSQRWLATGSRGVVVELVGWAGGSEGRGEGGFDQRAVGHTGWVVVKDT
jgi:hypothetical protein